MRKVNEEVILDKTQKNFFIVVNQIFPTVFGDKWKEENQRIRRRFNWEMFLNLQSIMMSFVRMSLFHSHLLCPFLLMESMCLCLQRRSRKKDLTAGKEKRENREEFAFTASLFKFPPPSLCRKGVWKKKEREKRKKKNMGNKRAWLGF